MTVDEIPAGYTTLGQARELAKENLNDLQQAMLRGIEADPTITDEVKTEVRVRVDAAFENAMELLDQKLDSIAT
jgi:hypothetical protein